MFKTCSAHFIKFVCTLKICLFPSRISCTGTCLPNFFFTKIVSTQHLHVPGTYQYMYYKCFMYYLQDCLGPGEDIFASCGGRIPEMWIGGSRVCQNLHPTYSIV